MFVCTFVIFIGRDPICLPQRRDNSVYIRHLQLKPCIYKGEEVLCRRFFHLSPFSLKLVSCTLYSALMFPLPIVFPLTQ